MQCPIAIDIDQLRVEPSGRDAKMKAQDRERVRTLELFRNMEEARFDALMAAAQL